MTSGRSGWAEYERQRRARAREAERQLKEAERARAAAEKERHRQYLESRAAGVDRKNQALDATVEGLGNLLRAGLNRSARIDFAASRRTPHVAPLELGSLAAPVKNPSWEDFAPLQPGMMSRLLGGNSRHQKRLLEATAQYEEALGDAKRQEAERQNQLAAARAEHARRVQAAEDDARKHNEALERQIKGLSDRNQAEVEAYLQQVLKRAPLPPKFPRNAEITFNPREEQVVVRFELPSRDVVPSTARYKYFPTKDEERPTARTKAELGVLYRGAISQTALLCIRDLFNSDPMLASVGFNGHVHATNPATGEREYPCIISLNVERPDFPKDDNLREVTAEACVQHLHAIVSNHPFDLEPIEPLLDFDLTKFSFIQGLDAVSMLDSRPDLMQMSPTNFEHLVRQIFEAQGAEGWTTQQSNDDGVDAVIVQRRALMGGLTIVQAKRYSNAIGPNHIRELAGAMEEKKAGWGVLITTSWFTAKSWEKAREHSRMELIDGNRLVFLVKDYLHKDVLIGIPNRPESHRDQMSGTTPAPS
jgi:restriction system protein